MPLQCGKPAAKLLELGKGNPANHAVFDRDRIALMYAAGNPAHPYQITGHEESGDLLQSIPVAIGDFHEPAMNDMKRFQRRAGVIQVCPVFYRPAMDDQPVELSRVIPGNLAGPGPRKETAIVTAARHLIGRIYINGAHAGDFILLAAYVPAFRTLDAQSHM